MGNDLNEIDALMAKFLNMFTNKGGQQPKLDDIFEIVIPEGVIIKNVAGSSEIFGIETFVEPRRRMLTDGTLAEFEEWEVSAKTQIAGTIAQRISHYRKAGIYQGEPFSSQGIKVTQWIKRAGQWQIAAASWDDEHAHWPISTAIVQQSFEGFSTQ